MEELNECIWNSKPRSQNCDVYSRLVCYPTYSKHDTLRDIVLERIRAVNEYIRSNVDGYIKKIVVFSPDKSSSRRHQKVKIYFNFVDDVEIPIISETITTETTYGRRKTS